MTPSAILFWLAILVPGQAPAEFHSEMLSIEDCLAEAQTFLSRPTNSILLKGGEIRVGCTVKIAPQAEASRALPRPRPPSKRGTP